MAKKSSSQLFRIVQNFVYLFPFFFPLYLIRFQVSGIPFTLLETLTYALFGLWLIELIRDRKIVNWNKRIARYALTVFLLLIGGTIGVLTAPHSISLPSGEILDAQRVALGIWKGWIFAPMLFFVVTSQVLTKKDEVNTLLRSFIYSSALIALMAYGLAIDGSGLTYDFRLSGFYESANYLSLYLVPAILLSIYFILTRNEKAKKRNLLELASLTVMVHALFFTQSYAAVLAVFGSLVLFVLYYFIQKYGSLKKAFGVVLILILTMAIVIATQWNSRKFQQFIDFENRSSTTVRFEIYEIAGNLIARYPLQGTSPGLFQARYQTEGPDILGHAPMEWTIPHPHNIFLAFWLEAGLIGLIAFLLLLVYAHSSFTFPIIALWGMILHGLFDTPFWKNDLAMIFWLIIAAILVLQNEKKKTKKRRNAIYRVQKQKTKNKRP